MNITQIALLTAFITITGSLKIPSFIPGTEFQLSAPLAVAICYAFGAKTYITAGVLSSLIGLILGTQNILNVIIAMIFRIIVPLVFLLLGRNKIATVVAGPIASTCSRLALGLWLNKAVWGLLLAALPGMLFTAVTAIPLSIIMYKVKNSVAREPRNVV